MVIFICSISSFFYHIHHYIFFISVSQLYTMGTGMQGQLGRLSERRVNRDSFRLRRPEYVS